MNKLPLMIGGWTLLLFQLLMLHYGEKQMAATFTAGAIILFSTSMAQREKPR
jgi:hypothetical protein